MEVATAVPFDILPPSASDSVLLSLVADSLLHTLKETSHEAAPSPSPSAVTVHNLSNGPILTAAATGNAPALPKRTHATGTEGINEDNAAVTAMVEAIPATISSKPTRRFDKLLVLDLDGTLVHSEFAPRPSKDHHFSLFNDEIFVYKRPGLDTFIRTILQWFDVAVWTASGCEYAAQIVKHIFPEEGRELAFLFSSARCTNLYCPSTGERTIIKDLKKAKRKGYDLRKMLIVDDTPSTFRRNYGNAVYIPPYWGTKVDDSLPLLLRYLERLGSADNVRTVDKRNWLREAISLLALELTRSASSSSSLSVSASTYSYRASTYSQTDLPDAVQF